MRKLILHMITSIDGFISDRNGAVNPATQWDEEVRQFYLDLFTAADGAVFGRCLYQQYVGHWDRVAAGQIPAETDLELRWAQRLRDMNKFVLSRTLENVGGNTIVLGSDIAEKLATLKRQPGGNLLLLCGPSLLAQLNAHHLIDEYMLYMCPSALGQGTHLFRDITEPVKLRFERTVPFRTGMNLHFYAPVYELGTIA